MKLIGDFSAWVFYAVTIQLISPLMKYAKLILTLSSCTQILLFFLLWLVKPLKLFYCPIAIFLTQMSTSYFQYQTWIYRKVKIIKDVFSFHKITTTKSFM